MKIYYQTISEKVHTLIQQQKDVMKLKMSAICSISLSKPSVTASAFGINGSSMTLKNPPSAAHVSAGFWLEGPVVLCLFVAGRGRPQQ